MREKVMGLCILLCLWVTRGIGAEQGITVEWVEGKVEQQKGTAWQKIDVGTTLGTDAIFRLSKDAFVELRYGSLHLRIRNAGTYKVADLIAKEGQKSTGATGEIVEKIARLIGKDTYKPLSTTVAGARGATQEALLFENLTWEEEGNSPKETNDPFEKIVGLYAEKRYSLVAQEARQIRNTSSSPDQAFKAAYWEAAALYAQDLVLPALQVLEKTACCSTVPEYGASLFLKARLYMDIGEWKNALESLEQYAALSTSLKDRQATLFLQALCYEKLMKVGEAKRILETTWKLDPLSEIGKEAADRLKGM
ncbi:MAG: hypothetical protein N2Z76_08135 [Treponemataceae bacterium]|nr:hypothetical protein [Treponemataceae bacterium]